MGASIEGLLTILLNGFAPLNKIATMSIYGEKKSFFRTKKAFWLNFGLKHQRLKVYKVCSNDDPRMTFHLFTDVYLSVY